MKKLMKKIMKRSLFTLALVLCLCFAQTTLSHAGDVPESLLGSSDALVFFGEVKEISSDKIVVVVMANIKGAAVADSEYEYDEWAFTEYPEVGQIYLCGYLDENNPLYVWEVTETDPLTLEIVNSDVMSKRMEQYLNEGEFATAQEKWLEAQAKEQAQEQKENEAKETSAAVDTSDGAMSVEVVGGADGPTSIFLAGKIGNRTVIGIGAVAVVVLGIVAVIFFRNKKKESK